MRATLTLVTALCLVSAATADAASVVYGDFSGNSVDFLDVTEGSVTDPLPLYGAPIASADTLDFNPVGYVSNSGGGTFDATIGVLTFDIHAKDGFAISSIHLMEDGDYTLAGTGTASTNVSVNASVFIDVMEVDGVGITPVEFSGNMVFTPKTTYSLPGDAGVLVIWTGNLILDINQLLTDNEVDFDLGATMVRVELDNALLSFSEASTIANIQKKDFEVIVATGPDPGPVIPEPATMAVVLALGGAAAVRRRRG